MLNKYRLEDGSIYWHKLYYAIMPRFMTRYSPPGGDYNYAAYLYQPHRYFIALYDHVEAFIQRGYRGYADRDIWGLDYYLAGWMPAALEQLRRTKHGTPLGMTPKGWDTRLTIIVDGFKAAKAMDDIPGVKRYRQLKRQMDKGLKMFAECYLNLWD